MSELADALLDWYAEHRRDLPWRSERTPYRVWLSEIMCQQTRVDTVIPYFQRFLDRWPTVEALAASPVEDVLSEWAGLGYYSRARNLHRAALAVAERGGFPDTTAGLRALPGVGAYTAGAIASLAFGRDAPVVDGNVERVLTRLAALELDARSTAGRRAVWAHAADLLPPGRGGAWNEALMELGALVCTPRDPACDACPIVSDCLGHGTGEPTRYPRKPRKKPPVRVTAACGAWVRPDGAVLMGRRPADGLLGGLWELPGLDGAGSAPERVARAFAERCGVTVTTCRTLGQVVHVFTHRHLTLDVLQVEAEGTPEPRWYTELAWLDRPAREGQALSTLARKTVALLG